MEVPFTHLQSKYERVILTDVAVVVSPVSDGEQKYISLSEKLLKTARLETDESVRDIKFNLGNAPANKMPRTDDELSKVKQPEREKEPSSLGWSFGFGLTWWERYGIGIVDNIQT